MRQGTIYPQGQLRSVIVRGIDPKQKVIALPTDTLLKPLDGYVPILIGKLMAKSTALKVGDDITLRFKDKHGTFDVINGQVVHVMKPISQTVDKGQIWLPLETLQKSTGLTNQATIMIVEQKYEVTKSYKGWVFKDHGFLLKEIKDIVASKQAGGAVMYGILLFLSMLAIFDTQVLSIFRRRKEIGTIIALGMTRARVIALFTLEGAMHGILAIALSFTYGTVIMWYTATVGIPLYDAATEFGIAMSDRMFPVFSLGLVGTTTFIVFLTVSIVSFMPTRKIAKLDPTEAIRGKIS
jgi:putative ABC transport system permease protein